MHSPLLDKTLFALLISALYAFLYLPIIILVVFSFNDGPFPAPWVGFSLVWYKELFHSTALWKAFYNSLIIAFSATILSIVLTLGLIYYQSCKRPLGHLLFLFYGTIFIPEVIFAIALPSFCAVLDPVGNNSPYSGTYYFRTWLCCADYTRKL